MMRVAPFMDRAGFGPWLTSLGLIGDAVELGTHRGAFAEILLANWEGRLTCVDPWTAYYDPDDIAAQGPEQRRLDYLEAMNVLSPYSDRVRIRTQKGEEVVNSFSDASLDFVYVDAVHRYRDVLADLTMWWPKVKEGSILAGHDIVCPGEVGGGWGVEIQPAVLEFAALTKVDIWLVVEINLPWSYYVVKESPR